MAVCRVKVGNTKLFWKYWTKSDHKHLIRPHSQNICKGVLPHKLQKEHSGDDFIPKIRSFFSETKRCLRVCIGKIAYRYYM